MKTKVTLRGPKTNDWVNAVQRWGARCQAITRVRVDGSHEHCHVPFESVVKIEGTVVSIIPVCTEHRRKLFGKIPSERKADEAERLRLQETIPGVSTEPQEDLTK